MRKRRFLLFLIIIVPFITGCRNEVSREESQEKRATFCNNKHLYEEDDQNKNDLIVDVENEALSHTLWSTIQGNYAWTNFRSDVVYFFESVADLNADWIVDHPYPEMVVTSHTLITMIASSTANVKIVDPALYQEIIEAIESVSEELHADERMAALLDDFNETYTRIYESTRADIIVEGARRRPFEYKPWVDYFDWEYRPDEMRWWIVDSLERDTEIDPVERKVNYVMILMYYMMNNASSTCPIWVMTAVNDETRDMIMKGLVERIVALQNGGFDLYRDYVEMLTDPRRVFDPRTQEVHDRIVQLIEKDVH
ncbi:MAG: hypothetical protein FWG67_05410 [Defluviitaleaceae bacterium]|nr:hypothetical protein [Defluviitaleaceae bacterium]